MLPNPSTKLEREARRALDRLAMDQFSAEEFAALEQRLLEDEAFRQAYVEQADLEAELENQLKSSPAIRVMPPTWSERRWPLAIATALSLLLGIGLTNLLLWEPVHRVMFGTPMIDYTESTLIGSRPVAIVIQSSESNDRGSTSLAVGDRVRPGVLKVNRGQIQLEFVNGVRMQLTGPTEVHLLSEMEATLVSGQTSLMTPPSTETFYLNGPVSAIASGSSEFVYRVSGKGTGSIDVYHGDVMASILGISGDTLRNEPVTANHTALFRENQLDVFPVAFAEQDRVSVMPVDDVSLNPSQRYAAMIHEDKPLVYWRFEEGDVEGDLLRNHMSDRYLGRLHTADDDSMVIDRGTLQFQRSNQSRFLKLNEPIQGLNGGDFSIELWVRVHRLHWGTFLGILPVEQKDKWQETHLSLLEYANRTNLVHRPATVRFLYRYPAQSFHGGLNSFSASPCIPGLWAHVVGVKSKQGTQVFVNGEQRLISDDLQFSDDGAYTAVIGQLDSVRPYRQFQGQMDEIAIYAKALTPEQIRRHYQAMTAPPQT